MLFLSIWSALSRGFGVGGACVSSSELEEADGHISAVVAAEHAEGVLVGCLVNVAAHEFSRRSWRSMIIKRARELISWFCMIISRTSKYWSRVVTSWASRLFPIVEMNLQRSSTWCSSGFSWSMMLNIPKTRSCTILGNRKFTL